MLKPKTGIVAASTLCISHRTHQSIFWCEWTVSSIRYITYNILHDIAAIGDVYGKMVINTESRHFGIFSRCMVWAVNSYFLQSEQGFLIHLLTRLIIDGHGNSSRSQKAIKDNTMWKMSVSLSPEKNEKMHGCFDFLFEFSITNSTKSFKMNISALQYMSWLMRTMDISLLEKGFSLLFFGLLWPSKWWHFLTGAGAGRLMLTYC